MGTHSQGFESRFQPHMSSRDDSCIRDNCRERRRTHDPTRFEDPSVAVVGKIPKRKKTLRRKSRLLFLPFSPDDTSGKHTHTQKRNTWGHNERREKRKRERQLLLHLCRTFIFRGSEKAPEDRWMAGSKKGTSGSETASRGSLSIFHCQRGSISDDEA